MTGHHIHVRLILVTKLSELEEIHMRKLASVQKISDIRPIEGADRIELAQVEGWQCVINKGQFQKGDLAVYFEIDSFLPVKSQYEFLRGNSFRKNELLGEGFRLRTMKFRGQISQGLLMPLSQLPELKNITDSIAAGTITEDSLIGKDVTELLGVVEWEVPEKVTGSGTTIGDRPSFIPKSDETRIQSLGNDFIKEFHGLEYYISSKMDGSSHSIGIGADGAFHVNGHNYEYKDDGKSDFYELVKKRGLEEKLRKYKDARGIKEISVSGEFCGPGIQSNRIGLKGPEWYIFTVKADGQRYGLREMQEVAETLDNPTVPIEEVDMDFDEKYPTVEAVLARADGNYETGRRKEGIVIRPTEPVHSDVLSGPLSMKAVSNKYLLKAD